MAPKRDRVKYETARACGESHSMRTIRCTVPGVVYHLISRFVDRAWFITHRVERAKYLSLLGAAMERTDWRCLAYVVMSNHIHLAMVAGEQPLAIWAKRVHGPFARWMNARHDRLGPLFVRGPRDGAVPPDKVREVIAYIHNNPVRAGLVRRAAQSNWSSHQAYVGRVEHPAWLRVTEGLSRAGYDANDFDRWVRSEPGDPCRPELGRIRKLARLRGAIEIGTPSLSEPPYVPLVKRPHGHVRVDPLVIVDVTAAAVGLTPLELCSRDRRAAVVAGRRIAVYAARALGVTGADIAAALGVSGPAVSQMKPHDELHAIANVVIERVQFVTAS